MPSCVFRKCTNYFSKVNKSHGLTYHSFPADDVELQEWIAIVRKQRCEADWIYSKQSKICSAHFRPEDLNKSGRRTLLMKGARPRIEKCSSHSTLPSGYIENGSEMAEPCKAALKAKVCELTKANEYLKLKNRRLTMKNERLAKKLAKTTGILKVIKKRYCQSRKLLHVNLASLASSLELTFDNNTFGSDSLEKVKVSGNILCRSCGSEVATSSNLISKFSPYSQYSFRDSIFDQDEVLVQVLGHFIVNYPVVITSVSNCVAIQEWVDSSWYPGYRWKPCLCPDCGEFIGWIFESIDTDSETQSIFFAHILTSLIGESFANSLTVIPGGLN